MPKSLGASSPFSLTHVIQVALTPVFLLWAIAALLNLFSSQLVRVADQVDLISAKLKELANSDTSDRIYELAAWHLSLFLRPTGSRIDASTLDLVIHIR